MKEAIRGGGYPAKSLDSGTEREQAPLSRTEAINDRPEPAKTRVCGGSSPTGS